MHAYLEAWNLHDPEAVATFFAPDAVYDDRGAGRVMGGIAAIRAHVARVQSSFPTSTSTSSGPPTATTSPPASGRRR